MIPLTSKQQAEVERLVTEGYRREEAEILVVESADDVDFTTPRGAVSAE